MLRRYEQVGPSFDGSNRLTRSIAVSMLIHAALVCALVFVASHQPAKAISIQVQLVNKKLGGGNDAEQGAPAAIKDAPKEAKAEPAPPPPPPPPSPEPPKEEKKPEPPKPEPKAEPPKEEPKKKPDIAKPEEKKPEKKPKEEKKKEEKPKEEPKKIEKKKEEKKDEKKPDKKKDEKDTKKKPDKKKSKVTPDAEGMDALTPMGQVAKNAKAFDSFKNNGDGSDFGIDPTKKGTVAGPAIEGIRGTLVWGMPDELSTWAGNVQKQVERNWQKPTGIPIGTSVLVSFWVNRQGEIIDGPKIVESGSTELGQSGLNAIVQAVPLPPLPESFKGTEQEVSYEFKVSE